MTMSAHNLKYLSLGVLVFQTSLAILAMRYSRRVHEGDGKYLSSTAVALTEVLKMFICLVVLFIQNEFSLQKYAQQLKRDITFLDTLKVLIPAGLYTLQNNLLFLALTHLDAATYQVTYQLKILTTAMFSVLMLGRSLSPLKWSALVVLMAGVALVQWPEDAARSSSAETTASSKLIGLLAVFTACFSSGFSGVYFEKLLKKSPQSMWLRNVQMAFFGIIISFFGVYLFDYKAVIEKGFLQFYTKSTWFVILLQAVVGLTIAAVMKYADNILKGFATSLSIILSTFVSYCAFGDFTPSSTFFIGATFVISATFMYGYTPPVAKTQSPTKSSRKSPQKSFTRLENASASARYINAT